MLSPLHVALVSLLRQHPELLVGLGALPGPAKTLQAVDADLTQLVPAELRVDLALTVGEPPSLALLVEVQLRRAREKRYTWPLYAAAMAQRTRCPVEVVVVTPHAGVARWAAEPIRLGLGTGVFQPLVIGPADIPVVTDLDHALAFPALAVLSGIAHGGGCARDAVLTAVAQLLARLRPSEARSYHDLVLASLSPASRPILENAMRKYSNEPLSDFGKQHFRAGVAEGLEKGRAEGRAEGEAHLVLRLLARRIGMPTAAQQAQVRALPLDAIEALGEELLDFTVAADLDAWLAAHPATPPDA